METAGAAALTFGAPARAACLVWTAVMGCVPALAEAPDTGKRLHRVNLEHFTLWSQRELLDTEVYETRQHLQNVRREVGRAFGGYFPSRKVDVVLTQEDVFRKYSGSPGHVAGLFDGRIHLPVRIAGSAQQRKAILHHEYTHALLWLASEGRCPVWVHEGFAVEQEESVHSRRVVTAERLVAGNKLLCPINELDDRLALSLRDLESAELAYQTAFSVARYIRSRHRPGTILRWIRRMGRAESWETAAREVLGESAADLEQGTIRFLEAEK